MIRTVIFAANTSWYLVNFRASTIAALVANGHEVLCIAPDNDCAESLRSSGAQFLCVPVPSDFGNLVPNLRAFISLFRLMGVIRPDICFTFTPKINLFFAAACWLRGVSHVPNISGLGSGASLPYFAKSLYVILTEFMIRASFHSFVQNHEDFERFSSALPRYKQKLERLPGSGVDLRKFSPASVDPDETWTFGMFARIVPKKGFEYFMEAAERLGNGRKYRFIVAGIPSERGKHLERRLRLLHERGTLQFYENVSDVRYLMSSCQYIVLPSEYAEGTPKCLIEACATGCGVITTDTPGCRDLVNPGENGVLIDPTADSLVSAIETVSAEASRFSSVRQASRKIAEISYDEVMIVNRYIELLRT